MNRRRLSEEKVKIVKPPSDYSIHPSYSRIKLD